MSRQMPSFQKMWDNYPDERDSTKVKKLIGGRVDASWITNTCTIRLSRAFNYAGDPIEKGLAGLNAVSGADGKWYAFRVREMEKYLRAKYGAPKLKLQRAIRRSSAQPLVDTEV